MDFDGRKRRAKGASARVSRTKEAARLKAAHEGKGARGERPERAKEAARAVKLSDWLGKKPQRAPKSAPKLPNFASLGARRPARFPDGSAVPAGAPSAQAIEAVKPPGERAGYKAWEEADKGGGPGPHWHRDADGWVYHAGKAWGVPAGGGWAWMVGSGKSWWTSAEGAPALLRHGGAWWWREKDGWYLLKDGQAWAWQDRPDVGGGGFLHPASGTQLVYSADGGRLAVLSPGADTVVYDAASGAVLARFPAKPAPRGLAGGGER